MFNNLNENIICFKREILDKYHINKNIFLDHELWNDIINNLIIYPRSEAEYNKSLKQLVVYVIIKLNNSYLYYRRTSSTSEKRLLQKYSIGVGGHVNSRDFEQTELTGINLDSTHYHKSESLLNQAIWREINEEITINSKIIQYPKLLCFINDDSDEVGKVHFGVVWEIMIANSDLAIKRKEGIGKMGFKTVEELKRDAISFENWSKMIIQSHYLG